MKKENAPGDLSGLPIGMCFGIALSQKGEKTGEGGDEEPRDDG